MHTNPHCGLAEPSRLEALDEILDAADGLGDLGRGGRHQLHTGVIPECS